MSAHFETVEPTVAGTILRERLRLGKLGQCCNWREVFFRSAAVLATLVFVIRASVAVAANPYRITLLLVVLTEALSTALLLLSRVPKARDTHPVALLCVGWAYLYSALLDVTPGTNLVTHQVGSAICSVGMLLTIWGKMAIGTSFGLLPATREVVCRGPYRFVRHPIYAGHFITHAGFLLSDLTLWNLTILGVLYLCQIVRVLREERVLRQEAAYRAYCREVPYRFCYGLL